MAFCETCGREIPQGQRLCEACARAERRSGQQRCHPPESPVPEGQPQTTGTPEQGRPPKPEKLGKKPAYPEKFSSTKPGSTKAPGRRAVVVMSGLLGLFLVFFGVALFFGSRGPSGGQLPAPTLESWQGSDIDTAPQADPGPEQVEVSAPDAQDVLERTSPVHTYQIVVEDVSWQEAYDRAQAAGGHLATITSQEEFNTICTQADQASVATEVRYLWLGGRKGSAGWTGSDCWITGENWTFDAWYPGEPSGQDEDGTPEDVLCMWNVQQSGWTFNDQRNDLLSVLPEVSGKVGYVIEFEG